MTDVRANRDDDRLPWLEAVDEDDRDEGPGAAKLIAFVVIGLLAIGLIVGGLFWMMNRTGDGASQTAPEGGELIAAPADDYKVKPDQPGGMDVKGKGDTALAASEGAEPKGTLNVDAAPEAPVAQPQQQAAAQPKAAPSPAAQRPTQVAIAQPKAAPAPALTPAATPTPAAAPAGGSGQTIQLGAFNSQAQAQAAWKALSGRFKYLAPLSQSVQTAEVGGKTYYRLRASGADARGICNRLKVAGETCMVV
jgi:hypothetical protein